MAIFPTAPPSSTVCCNDIFNKQARAYLSGSRESTASAQGDAPNSRPNWTAPGGARSEQSQSHSRANGLDALAEQACLESSSLRTPPDRPGGGSRNADRTEQDVESGSGRQPRGRHSKVCTNVQGGLLSIRATSHCRTLPSFHGFSARICHACRTGILTYHCFFPCSFQSRHSVTEACQGTQHQTGGRRRRGHRPPRKPTRRHPYSQDGPSSVHHIRASCRSNPSLESWDPAGFVPPRTLSHETHRLTRRV